MLLGVALGEGDRGNRLGPRSARFANRCASDGTMPRGNTNRMTISTPP